MTLNRMRAPHGLLDPFKFQRSRVQAFWTDDEI
jgi:hypothetical protein